MLYIYGNMGNMGNNQQYSQMNCKQQKSQLPENYLITSLSPEKKTSEFYAFDQEKKINFGEVWGQQTHARRRKMILQKHPEISQYLKPTKPYTVILAFVVTTIALTLCYFLKDASWPVFLLGGYWLGGTATHTLHILIHDLTHYLGHPNMNVNKWLAYMCNIPMGVPSSASFGKHHADHHNFMGDEHRDPDLPLKFESEASKNPFFKIFFWIFLTLFYAVRPMYSSPNNKLNQTQKTNIYVIMLTNLLILKFWGINAILYMAFVSFVSIGPHPAAAHTIAEHFQFVKGMQTYDYFGPWNFFNLNLGYHIEHHDFPACPWYNLPKIRAAAPEFYEHLPHHTSYCKLIGKFLFDFNFTLFNRTLRVEKSQ